MNRKKIIPKAIAVIFFFIDFSLVFFYGCIDQKEKQTTAYFAKLQSEKVLSDSLISWVQFGPGSAGYCEIVKYHPTNPDCVIMSPDVYNNYGSWDNGASWETINDCDGTSLGIRRIRDVTFSCQDPNYGLAIDERGWLWKTLDMGRHWEREYNFPAHGICSVITFDPADDKIIYVGSGNFWNVKWNNRTLDSPHRAKPIPTDFDRIVCNFHQTLHQLYQNTRDSMDSCKFDPTKYSRNCYPLISQTEYGKIWRSSDGGESWRLVNKGLPENADIGKILFHPKDSEVLYIATNYGLYKSCDRGESWMNIGMNLSHNILRDIAIYFDEEINKPILVVIDQVFWIDDGRGGIVSTGGVFKSCDEGKTWESLNRDLYLDLTQMNAFVVKSYYRAMAKWFGIPVEEAKTRFPELPGKVLQNFNRLLLDPLNPGRIYLGHNARHDISFLGGDLWKTENGGKKWIVCNRIGSNWQGSDKEFWEKRGNPTNTNMCFAHLSRSVNELPYGGGLGCRALTINSRGELIAVMQQQTLQSKDHGTAWQQIDAVETGPGSGCWVGTGCSNLTCPLFHMDSRMPDKYFLLCGEHGLWQMCGVGDASHSPSVKQVVGQVRGNNEPTSISTLAIHPQNTNIMYMQMYRQEHAGYLRKTTDGGRTWKNISRPIKFSISTPIDIIRTNSLLIDKDSPNHIYFCVPSYNITDISKQSPDFRDFGVYHSTDDGIRWKRDNNGLPAEANVTQLCFDPGNNRILYAAVLKSIDMKTKGGLYRTEDQGESWKALPVPKEVVSVNHVCIDGKNKNIYIACGASEGQPGSGGVWVSRDNGQTWIKIFHMPLVSQVSVAPYDSNRIAVVVGENVKINNLNSGIYLSFDRGLTWHKSNHGLGQPYWICDLRFDLANPEVMWCGLVGSGWYKGTVKIPDSRIPE